MTDSQSILKTSLLDLLYQLRDHNMPLILGGGYGLYLKQVRLQETAQYSTLIDGNLWPSPRATEDLDILLSTEVVVDSGRMGPIRTALDELGYTVIKGAEYMQFVKTLPAGQYVKVDFLTGPREIFAGDPRVQVGSRRVRLRQSVGLHAHAIDEALNFENGTMALHIEGRLSSGNTYAAIVQVPSAFTLLLMKLYAFRDRCQDEDKDLGRHHALDIYRIIAMMSEQEWEQTLQQIREFGQHPVIIEAARIVRTLFESPESLGSIRLREHPLWDDGMALDEFLSAIQDVFQQLD
jgi:hypothetical protein